jgi:hypothetical protein
MVGPPFMIVPLNGRYVRYLSFLAKVTVEERFQSRRGSWVYLWRSHASDATFQDKELVKNGCRSRDEGA